MKGKMGKKSGDSRDKKRQPECSCLLVWEGFGSGINQVHFFVDRAGGNCHADHRRADHHCADHHCANHPRVNYPHVNHLHDIRHDAEDAGALHRKQRDQENARSKR